MTWFPLSFERRLAVLVAALLTASAPLAAQQSTNGAGPGASPILKRIAERGEISIGHREASVPYSFINAQQQVEGYSIDMCMPVVEAVRKRLNRPDLNIKYVPINTTNRIALVTNGTIDLECGTTTNFLVRQEQVEFSPIFYVTGTQVLVKASASVAEFENLKGQRVAVLQASSNEAAARRLNDEKNLGIRFIYARDLAEGALLVQTDRVDAFLADGGQIKIFAATKAQPAGSLKVVGRLLTYDPYSAMMQRGDQDFALLVRRAFAETFRSGSAEKFYDKWFGPYGIALDDDLRAAFRVQAIPDTL
jgi:glutamate/aspartate transport system substrate-binding protein